MNEDKYTFTPEELSDESKIVNMMDNHYNDYEQELTNSSTSDSNLISEEKSVIVKRMLEKKKNDVGSAIVAAIENVKKTIAAENREIIEKFMPYDDFINSGTAVVKSADGNTILLHGTAFSVNKNDAEKTDVFGVLNQIHNESNKESEELRKIYRNLNQAETETNFANDYEEIYNDFNTMINTNDTSLENVNKDLANKIIYNIDSFKIENDKFIGEVDNEEIIIDQEQQNGNLYDAVQLAHTSYLMSDLILSELNLPVGIVHGNANDLANNTIADKGSTPIKAKETDIINMHKDQETMDLDKAIADYSKEMEFKNKNLSENEKTNTEISPVNEEKTLNSPTYREKRDEINKDKKLTPKERKTKLHTLRNVLNGKGEIEFGDKIFDLLANPAEAVLYRTGYSARKMKGKALNFINGTVFSYFNEKIKDKEHIRKQKETEENKDAVAKETEENKDVVADVAEESVVKSDDSKKEEVTSEVIDVPENKLAKTIDSVSINKNDDADKKYKNLLDNTCKNLDSKNLSPEDLEKELTILGLTNDDYKESKARIFNKKMTDVNNKRHIKGFENDLSAKISKSTDKAINDLNAKLKEDLKVMKGQLEDVVNLNNIQSQVYADEISKIYVPTAVVNNNELSGNFADEFNQLFGVEEQSTKKTK